MKNNLTALIFGAAIVTASIFLGNAYIERTKSTGYIQVTGQGKTNFTSDLIVWEGNFKVENTNQKEGFEQLKKDKLIIHNYLLKKGISEDEIVFSAVNSSKNT